MTTASPTEDVACLDHVSHAYGKTVAVDDVNLRLPSGCTVAFIGPDGVGKSTVLGLIAGVRKVQSGTITVLGGDIRSRRHRRAVCPRIAYMPQGLGKNLYMTLSVYENVDFFGRLFGQEGAERSRHIEELLEATGLAPFRERPAGKLSGGMKQKLGLCCALIHDPDLLLLDEPTTGVDPLSRRQFWALVDRIRSRRSGMSIVTATAYMEEAQEFDRIVAMDDGRILATGSPQELMDRTSATDLDEAFIRLLPETKRADHRTLVVPPPMPVSGAEPAIRARELTKRFEDFTAVDRVSFEIQRGEIFGFLGSNGCGKTTTMKMLTGLLPPTSGEAWLFGEPVDAGDLQNRQRVGFMSQAFSLYGELTVRQNLELHARVFRLPEDKAADRISKLIDKFGLATYVDERAEKLPLGIRQRLSLAVAVIHEPETLILDEPTSGVDPIARDGFWELLVSLSRDRGVTIFISTHYMNEGERCDRISLMHAGKVLASDKPAALIAARQAATLEEAFIDYLEEASGEEVAARLRPQTVQEPIAPPTSSRSSNGRRRSGAFSLARLLAYARREAMEILRDPVRQAFSLFGTAILMLAFGYGITSDVEDITFAVLDRDQTPASRSYAESISSSRYFEERAPISDTTEMDRRMISGELSLAVEIPSGFGIDVVRGDPTEVAAWLDGANPSRAETAMGYVEGIHKHYLSELHLQSGGATAALPAEIETRFRYNQSFESINAMVPAVIALLLMMFPSMLTALGVVREKELGSITNLYATPVTRLEFLLGKQLPYIAMGMINYLELVAMAVFIFDVPLKGSFLGLTLAAVLYVTAATGLGLTISAFTTSQVAAVFGTMIITMIAAVQYSGLLDPVSSLQGGARLIGESYPTTYFLLASVGAFTKSLDLGEIMPYVQVLALMSLVYTLISVAFVRKQGR